MKKTIVILLISLAAQCLHAQEMWTLERCVEHAWENSLDVRQAQNSIEFSDVDLSAAKQSRLPNLNGNVSFNSNFGRSIDPVTNEFEAQNFASNSFSLSGGVLLYNAGRINKTIQSAELSMKAAELDEESAKNTVAINVINAFLQVLMSKENIQNAEERVQLIQSQYENTKKLVAAGALAENEQYAIEAQLAREDQNLITAINNYDLNLLALKQLLFLETDYDMGVTAPDIDEIEQFFQERTFDEVYIAALKRLPDVKAAEERVNIALLNKEISRTAYYPSITFGVGGGTNWSSLAKAVEPTGQAALVPQPGVFIDGEPVDFATLQPQFDINDKVYSEQLNENFNYGLSINASIPIYNNGQVNADVQRAKLNTDLAQINADRTKQTIKTNVQTAVANLKAAIKQYQASERSMRSLQLAADNAQKQYDLGVINAYDLLAAQNNLQQMESENLVAKYDLVFRSKLVDFYMGIPLKL